MVTLSLFCSLIEALFLEFLSVHSHKMLEQFLCLVLFQRVPRLLQRMQHALTKKSKSCFSIYLTLNNHQTPQEEEIRQLKRELEIIRQERDVLKKAIGIFSQHQG